ncbi:MAG: ornithine cyclodeaminase family protein [Pseudomonadota bacterium]
MRTFTAEDVDRILAYPALVGVLDAAFRDDIEAPLRHHHTIDRGERADGVMLLMPAWSKLAGNDNGYLGVKLVNVYPDNSEIGEPGVQAAYILMNGRTGAPLAMIDGKTLTTWRTAGASALAARYLARPDAAKMVMVGAGAMAPYLIRAHASVRPITQVTIWNRTIENAVGIAERLDPLLPETAFSVSEDLESAIREADLISCATFSNDPLVKGAWLKPGAHLDLVGAFTPSMRESDDEAVRRSSVFVDTRIGALVEGGDVVLPIKDGVIKKDDVKADLFDLCRSTHPGRASADEITFFKSTGASLEDLAAAIHLYEQADATN